MFIIVIINYILIKMKLLNNCQILIQSVYIRIDRYNNIQNAFGDDLTII